MTDEAEQKLDAAKIQPPSDAVARPSVIRTKEDEAIWDEMQKPHKLGKHESATHIGLTPEVIAEMQSKGQAGKFEFFDSKAEEALAALQQTPKEQTLIASNNDGSQANRLISDITSGGNIAPGTLLLEPWMLKLGTDTMGALAQIAMHVSAQKMQEMLESVKIAVVNPIEHPYRDHELDTLALVPESKWKEAHKAFPDIQKIGGLSEEQTTKLMKAIIANELKFYGPEDKGQDAIAANGQGGFISDRSIGFAQLTTRGIKNLSGEIDKLMTKNGTPTHNPLSPFAALDDNELARELLKPENLPLFVAAHVAHNVRMLNNHKPEVSMTLESLGYQFNADLCYAQADKEHKNPMTKKEAVNKHIPYDSALPTAAILEKSEHAKNIREWLKKVHL